jgi:hypothetical protein
MCAHLLYDRLRPVAMCICMPINQPTHHSSRSCTRIARASREAKRLH